MSTMEPHRWQRVEEIFHLALQYDDAEREAHLTRMCGEDRFLLDEVRSLISSHERSGEFLAKPQLTAGLQLLAVRTTQSREGQTIGHYSLRNRIGFGGMGEVYLALDQRLGRNVALKLLPSSFNDHPDWVRRFQNEARAASSIAHPNIAHVYEVGESDGQHYIAMEYIEGVTLREYHRRARLKPLEAIDITIQIVRALSAAHAVGVLHRDIKPDNVMIHREGYVKVLDFGLAKSTPGLKSPNGCQGVAISSIETGAGIIVGSPAYMSPEQARGKEVDHRSDLWSVGVVLYELLAQKSPFLSDTPSDTMAAILKTDPSPLGLLVPELPGEIERVVTKLLAKEAGDRYQSAESLIADLCDLTEALKHRKNLEHHPEQTAGVNGSALVSGFNQPQSQPTFKSLAWLPTYVRNSSKPTRLGLSALLLIALVALLMLRYSGYSAPESPAAPITSIAVLPFANENGDPNNQYISDGLSESLIERFSRLSRIKVIARNSAFRYKKSAEFKKVARDLGVQALVTGTVTQQGDDLQVSVELIDANQAGQLWSGQYREKASNLPLILNDITHKIADKLNIGLSGDELNLITREQNRTGNAYERYLKGRFYWNRLTEEALHKSIESFNEALAIDPQYALAYAGLANSYIVLGGNYSPPDEAFRQAELNAQKALEIDADLAEAHYAMATTRYLYHWDLSGAEKELKRSLELNPNYAMANHMLCSVSLTRGDTTQAAIYIGRALELDPFYLLFNVRLSSIYYYQRDNERTIELAQKLLSETNEAPYLYNTIAIAHAQKKRFKEALAASKKATSLLGEDADTLSTLGIIYALSGRVSEARWVAETLEGLSQKRYVQAYLIASIYGALDDRNQAFAWLEKAAKQRNCHMLRIRLDPVFDKLRSDSRYDRLLESVNFE